MSDKEPIRKPSLAYAAGWDVQGFRIGSKLDFFRFCGRRRHEIGVGKSSFLAQEL